MAKHKVFVSYYHADDQGYREALRAMNLRYGLFHDWSVDTGGVDEGLPDQRIREIIRDDYLRDSTVTIVLVGTRTRERKHVDWEIYSSMYNGSVNKQSGVLAITLPTTGCSYYFATHGEQEKSLVYPAASWMSVATRAEHERRYPHMPARIVDNLVHDGAKVSVTNWDIIAADPERLRLLIELTFRDRASCDYDLSRPMRRANSPTKWF